MSNNPGENEVIPYRVRRSSEDFEDINIIYVDDAVEVLDQMTSRLKTHGFVSVGYFYDLIGIESRRDDEKWGWYDLSQTKTSFKEDGFRLGLPSTESIDRDVEA